MKSDSRCPMCDAADIRLTFQKTLNSKEYRLATCNACGQNFCDPPPTAAEIVGFYQGDYHVQLREKGATEKEFGAKFNRYRDWVLQFVKPGRSLDIGTATGLFPSLLKEAGFEAEGLEYNEASAEWGRTHYGVKIQSCDLAECGAGPDAYDLISMTDVLEHTENPLGFLRSVRNYLKPGGCMLITFPDIWSVESRYTRILSRFLRRDRIWYCCHIPLHVWEFTPHTARAMFQKAGFEVLGLRRSQEALGTHLSQSDALLLSPLRLLRIPAIGRMWGTQMEFMIRKPK